MRIMINQLLGWFGLQLVRESENALHQSIKQVEELTGKVEELQERNRQLLKRLARHVASMHYYKKNYLRLRGKGEKEEV